MPKGLLEAGETTRVPAAREAFEEAGVVGVSFWRTDRPGAKTIQ
ncbi:NUDIX domain-containing protein [Sinorhizobium mexicanum]|nr:NUDIX domain-containing protein [Sinorhizobium mexicanum]